MSKSYTAEETYTGIDFTRQEFETGILNYASSLIASFKKWIWKNHS